MFLKLIQFQPDKSPVRYFSPQGLYIKVAFNSQAFALQTAFAPCRLRQFHRLFLQNAFLQHFFANQRKNDSVNNDWLKNFSNIKI